MGKIRWLGHAAFEIRLADKVILVDPFLDGNPVAACKASEIVEADIVCVTHDHDDHLGDAIPICRRTGATFIATYELSVYAQQQNVRDVIGLNVGGATEVRGIGIVVVQAFHTATRGSPTGFILYGEGKGIYHAGDTTVFRDMELIRELYRPNVALLPIGGYYTMGSREAAKAVELLKPDVVIPMHYGTFPVLASSADEFVKLAKERAPEVKVVVLGVGETYEF